MAMYLTHRLLWHILDSIRDPACTEYQFHPVYYRPSSWNLLYQFPTCMYQNIFYIFDLLFPFPFPVAIKDDGV